MSEELLAMSRTSPLARTRPGWDRLPTANPVETLIGQRRWRILQNAQPLYTPTEPVPSWIRMPEQFVEWLAIRLTPTELRGYFHDLEQIARQSCDLEMLRFAKRYLGPLRKRGRG
jgi:hypothetical protein